jgi:predicted Rossmann fold flavoprotein
MSIIVIGAGPSGLTAALAASEISNDIVLFNKNPEPGKKLAAIPRDDLFFSEKLTPKKMAEQFGQHAGFVSPIFKAFGHTDLARLFKKIDLELQEDGHGHFKADGLAGDQLCNHLLKVLIDKGVTYKKSSRVTDLIIEKDKTTGVLINNSPFPASSVILATGSFSSPKYGATRDGYDISARLGHRVNDLKPALVDLITQERYGKVLSGVILDDVKINIFYANKLAHSEIGRIKFTSNGISGPVIINRSAEMIDQLKNNEVEVRLDFMPDQPRETFDSWLIKQFMSRTHVLVGQFLSRYLNESVINVIELESRVKLDKSISHITNLERKSLIHAIKDFRLTIKQPKPFNNTRGVIGGVSPEDIDPSTMQSRKIKGLFFAGDVIDVLGPYGGFNMQFAFSTGYIAGKAAATAN